MATRILRVCIFEACWQNLGDFILMHTEAPNGIVNIHYIFTRTTLGGLSETALEVFWSSMGVGSDSPLQMNVERQTPQKPRPPPHGLVIGDPNCYFLTTVKP